MKVFNLSGNSNGDDDFFEQLVRAFLGGGGGEQVGIYVAVVNAEGKTVSQFHSPADSESKADATFWSEPCEGCGGYDCRRRTMARFMGRIAEDIQEATQVETLEECGGQVLEPVAAGPIPSSFEGFVSDLNMDAEYPN